MEEAINMSENLFSEINVNFTFTRHNSPVALGNRGSVGVM